MFALMCVLLPCDVVDVAPSLMFLLLLPASASAAFKKSSVEISGNIDGDTCNLLSVVFCCRPSSLIMDTGVNFPLLAGIAASSSKREKIVETKECIARRDDCVNISEVSLPFSV